MSKKIKSYCLNGKYVSIGMLSKLRGSEIPEQRQIANAVLQWHNDDSFTFETSGSTGQAQKIIFTKNQVISSVELSQRAFGLTARDKALLCLPVKYVAGRMMLYRALHIGMDLKTTRPQLDLMTTLHNDVSFAAMMPMQVESCLSSERGTKWLQSIRVLLVGGAPINSKLIAGLKSFKNAVFHTYGMTETLTHVALRCLSKGGSQYFSPLPGIKLSVSSDNTLRLYAQHLDVEVSTNDLVKFNKDGKFQILGRTDNIINSGGLKIYPEELEFIIKENLHCELAIIGLPDESLGERVVLIIEGDKKKEISLKQACKGIKRNKQPREIIYIDSLPKTTSGKLMRNKIKEKLK